MSKDHHIIPVWFFIGGLLLIYGVLILISGIAQISHPPDVVLSNLHAPLWWGILLILIGAFYVWKFFPRKS